jgi:exodeoxyribonuclease VII large subunit
MEGLFAAERKKPLPSLPSRIGIVTSPKGAVIHDMLNVLQRRAPGRHIRVYPVAVQGEGAAEQIAEGIGYFAISDWPEVIIVARGGGSLEDLWAFNDEAVARVIAASSIPVISAVGHETDFTIADFVADLRAPTPSAAAELVAESRARLIDCLDVAEHKLKQSARLTMAIAARRLHRVAIDGSRVRRAVGRRMQRVDEMEYRLRDSVRSALSQRTRKLDQLDARLTRKDVRLRFAEARRRREALDQKLRRLMDVRIREARGALAPTSAKLEQLSPLTILERGYAIVVREDGERDGVIVKGPEDAPVDSNVRLRVARGELRAKIL